MRTSWLVCGNAERVERTGESCGIGSVHKTIPVRRMVEKFLLDLDEQLGVFESPSYQKDSIHKE